MLLSFRTSLLLTGVLGVQAQPDFIGYINPPVRSWNELTNSNVRDDNGVFITPDDNAVVTISRDCAVFR